MCTVFYTKRSLKEFLISVSQLNQLFMSNSRTDLHKKLIQGFKWGHRTHYLPVFNSSLACWLYSQTVLLANLAAYSSRSTFSQAQLKTVPFSLWSPIPAKISSNAISWLHHMPILEVIIQAKKSKMLCNWAWVKCSSLEPEMEFTLREQHGV